MKFTFLLITFVLFFEIKAQAPEKFYARYGGSGYDVGYDVKQTLDKGYIITGSTSSMGVGNTDMYLLKLDSMGHVKFQNTFGNANNDIGKEVIQLIDSSYIMVGYTNSIGFGGYDIFLVKADKYGMLQWQKTIGSTDWDFANSLQQTTDGGFIIAGSTYSYGYGNEDGYVIKTDANGNITWSKTFGGPEDDGFKSVIQTSDGGYALCGTTKSYGDENGDAWVFKLLANGDSAWSKTFGGVKEDFVNKVIQLQNGDVLVAGGNTNTSNTVLTLLIRYDNSTGNQLWDYPDPGSNSEYYNSCVVGLNNNFVGCGKTKNPIYGNQALIDVYTPSFGYVNFYAFATGNNDELFSVCKTKDKGFALVGSTQGTFFTLQDVLFMKIDSVGNYGGNITSINSLGYESLQVQLFPNPTTDNVNCQIKGEAYFKKLNFKIVDIKGTEYLKSDIHENTFSFSVKEFSSGLYFIQLFDGNNLLKIEKISVIR